MTIHVMNLILRLAMLAMGATISLFIGFPNGPGLASAAYANSEWDSLDEYEWANSALPHMKTVVYPGSMFVPCVWFVIVISLFASDMVRCALVFQNSWNACDNHIDMMWYQTALFTLPILFAYVALLLGTHDIILLMMVATFTELSSMCAVTMEFMRTVVNTEATPYMECSVMLLLQAMYDVSLASASQVVLTPFFYNLLYSTEITTPLQTTLAICFMSLVIALFAIQHSHQARCSTLETHWLTNRSVVRWGRDRLFGTEVYQPGTVEFPRFEGGGGFGKFQECNEEDDDGTSKEETSEDLYNRIYGCHIYGEKTEMRPHGEIYATPVRAMSWVTPVYTDEIGSLSRLKIGILVEWRRYYAVNMIINYLLIIGMIQMTSIGSPLQSDILG